MEYQLAAQWPDYPVGQAVDVVVAGAYAYVALQPSALVTMDISDPAHVRRTSGIRGAVDLVPSALTMADGFLFLANSYHGLSTYDLTDPAHPRAGVEYGTDSLDFWKQFVAIAVDRKRAYLARRPIGSRTGNLTILDVSQPGTQINDLGEWSPDDPGLAGFSPQAVAVGAGYAYVSGGWHGLVIVDVHDPANPRQVGWLKGIYVSEVVLGESGFAFAIGAKEWSVVDVGDPAHPVVVRTVPSGVPGGVERRRLARSGDLALAYGGFSWSPGFDIFDLANALDPIRLGTVGGASWTSTRLVDGRAYMVGYCGFRLMSLADPVRPTLLAELDLGGWVDRLAMLGDRLLVGSVYGGIHLLDVRSSGPPVRLGWLPLEANLGGMATAGNVGYVCETGRNIRMLDLGAESGLPVLGEIAQADGMPIVVDSSRLYGATRQGELTVYDVTKPSAPARLATVATRTPSIDSFAVRAGLACVVGTGLGMPYQFELLDLADPTAPRSLVVQRAPGTPYSNRLFNPVFVGSRLYLQMFEDSSTRYLWVLDVSDPAHPVSVAKYPQFYARQMMLTGNTLVAIQGGSQAYGRPIVLDVSDPSVPKVVGEPGPILRATSVGVGTPGRVYCADDTGTVTIFEPKIDPPTIVRQPAGQSVADGAKAVFYVNANGSEPLTVQWLKEGVVQQSGTNRLFTIERVRPADAGQYRATVSNGAGTVTSEAAELQVRPSRTPTLSGTTSGAGFRVEFLAAASVKYTLEHSVNLVDWRTGASIVGAGSVSGLVDPDGGVSSTRFYRLRSEP